MKGKFIVQVPYGGQCIALPPKNQIREWWDNMAWGARIYSKGRIDRAGQELARISQLPEPDYMADYDAFVAHARQREEEIRILDNWRSCHAYPLQVIKMTLFRRSRKIDPDALVAQRMKRRPSIEIKLRDNPNMKLSQMQDIGGCRAVLSSIGKVRELVEMYKEAHAKSPKNRSDWDGSDDFDYIACPKPDGYRSIHMVFRFQSSSEEHRVYNGQRIEVQMRTKLQHAWATAVETAQLFTGQALKSKTKNASEDWLRFFTLASSLFALREKSPTVPGAPNNREETVEELREIVSRTEIMQSLSNWNDTVHLLELKDEPDAYFYLLTLDAGSRNLRVQQFRKEEAVQSQFEYDKAEKEADKNPNLQVVLVSTEDLDALRKAYPSYYVDTKDFIQAVEQELKPPK
jgi:ppGpp synthetase/RelA/SpoT-type nucleotidyltranferase